MRPMRPQIFGNTFHKLTSDHGADVFPTSNPPFRQSMIRQNCHGTETIWSVQDLSVLFLSVLSRVPGQTVASFQATFTT